MDFELSRGWPTGAQKGASTPSVEPKQKQNADDRVPRGVPMVPKDCQKGAKEWPRTQNLIERNTNLVYKMHTCKYIKICDISVQIGDISVQISGFSGALMPRIIDLSGRFTLLVIA